MTCRIVYQLRMLRFLIANTFKYVKNVYHKKTVQVPSLWVDGLDYLESWETEGNKSLRFNDYKPLQD